MKTLVTGAAGFIGGHIAEALAHDGHLVVGLDVKPPSEERAGDFAYFARLDLRDWGVQQAESYEAIVHCAAYGGVARAARVPRFIFEANAVATAHLVEQAKRNMPNLRAAVHISSFSVYGASLDKGEAVDESAPLEPLEPYAASKLAQELAWTGSGLPYSVLRCSSVYGRRMRITDPEATILAKLAGWIGLGEEVQLFEDGLQTRDFVHVSDVADAVRAEIDVHVSGVFRSRMSSLARVNVCSGERVQLLEACEHLAKVMGRPLRYACSGQVRPGDMRHCLGNPARMRALLGRDPKPFDVGIREAFGQRPMLVVPKA